MLKNISWSNYWITIVITVIIYYMVIFYLYYREDIKQVLNRQSNVFFKLNLFTKNIEEAEPKAFIEKGAYLNPTDELLQDELFSSLHQFMNEIRRMLEGALKNRSAKQEIIYSFQRLSETYPNVKASPFKAFITNYMLVECANYCTVHLDESDLIMLWQ